MENRSVRGKFRVKSITEYEEQGKEVKLEACIDSGNEEWSKWTPSGSINIYITNPDAAKTFIVGFDYYVDFTSCGNPVRLSNVDE